MKNILFYCPRYPHFGGIEIVTTYIAGWLSENGYRINIFSFDHSDDKLLQANVPEKVKVEYSPTKEKTADENVVALKSLLAREKIDIVVMQDSYASGLMETLFSALEDFPKVKLVVAEHNAPNHIELLYEYRSRKSIKEKIKKLVLLRRRIKQNKMRHLALYNRADKYVVLSKEFIPVWENVTALATHPKLTYINNPVTIKQPLKIELSKKRKECLFVGRLTEQKGLKLLMPIWEKIERQCPDWKLVIVGDGCERNWVERYISEHQLKNVVLEGMQSNTIPYYERASLLLATSLFEGWLLTLSESMIYATPPQLYDTYAAAKEIVTSGKDGSLIKPMDETEYVETAVRLMKNEQERNILALNAHESAKRFSIESIGKQWAEMFETI